jgi:hypothetical protein
MYASRLQLAHSIIELLIDASIISLLGTLFFYTRNTELPLKTKKYSPLLKFLTPSNLALLSIAFLALGSLAGRTSCLATTLGALPPLNESYPLVLMAVGMNADLSGVALLILCTGLVSKEKWFMERRGRERRDGERRLGALELEMGLNMSGQDDSSQNKKKRAVGLGIRAETLGDKEVRELWTR